jgi:hypothetical protein
MNLYVVNEYVDDVTIPTQVIKYNQHFFQADQNTLFLTWKLWLIFLVLHSATLKSVNSISSNIIDWKIKDNKNYSIHRFCILISILYLVENYVERLNQNIRLKQEILLNDRKMYVRIAIFTKPLFYITLQPIYIYTV